MLKLAGWVVGIALFVWVTVSAFSIFSELKFLVDGWSRSVGQVPILIKTIALTIGKYVSGIVSGYREFVHGLVAMLHLPHLPQLVYDLTGVVTFSIGRGKATSAGRKIDRPIEKSQVIIEKHRQRFPVLIPHSDFRGGWIRSHQASGSMSGATWIGTGRSTRGREDPHPLWRKTSSSYQFY